MKIKKKTIILIVLIFCALAVGKAFAVTACPEPFKVKQPDGKEFMARLFGDEFYSGIETVEGYTISKEPSSGYWVYAKKTSSGELYPSDLVVGYDSPKGISKHLRDVAAIRMTRSQRFPGPPLEYIREKKIKGNLPMLIIVTEFTDQKLVGSTKKAWRNFFKLVQNYWKEVSYNQIKIVPVKENNGKKNDGICHVTVDQKHPNVFGSSANIDDDNRNAVRKGILAVNKHVNFKQYDKDNDGFISANEMVVYQICAAYEASYSDSRPNVWGHKWSLGWGAVASPICDGVRVADYYGGGNYAQSGEWFKSKYATPRSSQIAGLMTTIGIVCHEMGHNMGQIDLYDTDGSSNGIGKWGVMGSGSWCFTKNSGDSPAHPCAWTKLFFGWINPKKIATSRELDALKKYRIKAAATSKTSAFYQLGKNPNGVEIGGTGEYFLIENRQKLGYDRGLPGDGLLIWHIDESKSNNTQELNTKSLHRLVDLEQADGLSQLNKPAYNRGDTGDPFPGSTNNKKFTKTTKPNSKLYGGKNSKVQVTTISKSKKTMTAKLSGK